MQFPPNPLAAVTHPDPYPYYRQLTLEKPLAFDPELKLWIASSAATIEAVMAQSQCRVRPASEPIPGHLLNSPAAVLFSHFVRMQDGEKHRVLKQALDAAFASLDDSSLEQHSQHGAQHDFASLADMMFELPVFVVGGLLGIPASQWPQLAIWIHDFVPCLSISSSHEQQNLGKVAAGHLLESLRALLAPGLDSGLLFSLWGEIGRIHQDAAVAVAANAVGFIVQAYEATAGLIGNTLVALTFYHDLRKQLTKRPEMLRRALCEVLRYDSPIQNTRRFVSADCTVAGQTLKGGDTILLILAAANRDPAIHRNPDQFDFHRVQQPHLAFGRGTHRCPGSLLAQLIAEAGIRRLLASGFDFASLAGPIRYRPSINARVPIFHQQIGDQAS